MGIYDSMLVKYGAVMIGYTVIGLPVFGPRRHEYLKSIGDESSKITKDYVRNSSLLINIKESTLRIETVCLTVLLLLIFHLPHLMQNNSPKNHILYHRLLIENFC